MINSILVYKFNSTFGDYILNFIRIDSNNMQTVNMSNKKWILILLYYIIPILYDIFKHKIIEKIKLVSAILDLCYKFKFMFDLKFCHSDFIEHILGIMTVNQGNKDNLSDKLLNIGRQLNLFFLYMFMKFGEWYYSKENIVGQTVEIKPPIKNIESSVCPTCKNTPNIPCALKCCGIVFCERCISNLDKCPICKSEPFPVKIYN
jgi:hypothetical protein